MEWTFDQQEVFFRIIKYLIEGVTVAAVALLLQRIYVEDAIILGLVAAAVFSIIDLISPSIGVTLRNTKLK